MKKSMLKIALAAPLFLLALSCQKEQVTPQTGSSSSGSPAALKSNANAGGGASESINFHYGDKVYPVTVTFSEDENNNLQAEPVLDESFLSLKKAIQNMPLCHILVEDMDDYYLYSTENELIEIQGKLAPEQSDKAKQWKKDIPTDFYKPGCVPYYRMYQHINYVTLMYDAPNGSGMLGFGPTTSMWATPLVYCLPWVGSANNDQMSSLVIKGGTLFDNSVHRQYVTLFKHINYGGPSLTFWADGCTTTNINDLRKFWIWQFLFFGENWNDEVSSFRAYYYIY